LISWFYAIGENELIDGGKMPLILEGNNILLIRQEGVFYAISNKCPHMECPLSRGILDGYVIKCPCHDWQFDIRNGEFLTAREIKNPVFDTKVSDGRVFVKICGAVQ
jgi:nitrite reductase/ring-hydroxylating ferredoxin subunit